MSTIGQNRQAQPNSKQNVLERIEGSFTNRRKQHLHTLRYPSKTLPPAALLFLHHGLAEHCGRYDKVCRRFAATGVEVYAYDAHGHGVSEPLQPGDRAFIASYTDLVDDFCDYIDLVLTQHPLNGSIAERVSIGSSGQSAIKTPPVFLLGHSMGGLVAALACLRHQDRFAGLMMHSPALDVEWTPMLRAQALVGGLLASVVPRARLVPAVRPEDLSPDPQVVADYVADPLNTVGPVRTRTANELLTAFAEIRRRAPELRLPVYVCHGTRDATTSASMSKRFVEGPWGVSSTDRTFRSVQDGYHELLHGPEWQECTDMMLKWMQAHGARIALCSAGGPGAVPAGATSPDAMPTSKL